MGGLGGWLGWCWVVGVAGGFFVSLVGWLFGLLFLSGSCGLVFGRVWGVGGVWCCLVVAVVLVVGGCAIGDLSVGGFPLLVSCCLLAVSLVEVWLVVVWVIWVFPGCAFDMGVFAFWVVAGFVVHG